MSIQALSWVLDHSPVSGNDRLVLIVLAHHANKDNPWAFVGYDTIAQETRASRATAIRSIARLVECGAIESRKSAGRNCNEYRVVTEAEAPLPPTVPNCNGSLGTVATTVATGRRNSSSNSINHENRTLYRTEEPNDEQKNGAIMPSYAFDDFWAIYPRREAKGEARKAWTNAVRRASPDVILAGAARFRDDPNRDPAFTPHPATWLNHDRWEDDPLPPRNGGRVTAGSRTMLNLAALRSNTKELEP